MTLTNLGTADKRTAVTDGNGNYRFLNIAPANYRLDFELSGFKRLTREPVVVQVESTVRIDAVLQIGNISETVEVTSETPLLQTESSSLSHVVESATVQEMPLNGRNVMNLIALVPGVVPQGSTVGHTIVSNQSTGHTNDWAFNNYQIGGGQAGQSASVSRRRPDDRTRRNKVVLVATQDAVQEFRVATNNVSAEYGRFGGGVVNMATKSGTNEFHGSAYEYFRNKVLNANTFFGNMFGTAKAGLQTRISTAPPWAGLYAKTRPSSSSAGSNCAQLSAKRSLLRVPTAAVRAGDFSALSGRFRSES